MHERRRHEWWRMIGLAVAIALNMVMVGTVLVDHQDVNKQADDLAIEKQQLVVETKALGDQHEQLVEACQRLQLVRLGDNVSHYADWLAYGAVLKTLPGASPIRPAVALAKSIKAWVPHTDCTQAVNEQGVRYRAPQPVLFDQRLPGPDDLLHVRPFKLTTP